MSPDEYRACIRALGLTPTKPSYEGSTLHVDRNGDHTLIPDAESMPPEQRVAMIQIIKVRLGISNH